MFRKIVLTAVALTTLSVSSSYSAISEDVVKETIVKHSMEMGVDPALALSIAKKESGFKHELKSSHGAVGVFQLLPSTANKIGYNPYYLSENIKAGLTYYKMMYKMFGSKELALAAYNAGPGNVKKFNAVPPYAETRRFVDKILAQQKIHQNDPCVLQAKAPVAENNVTVSENTEEDVVPVDLDEQKQSSIIIKMVDQEVTAI